MGKQAVVLAAGKGTRLLPLTKDTPKPLVKVAGKPFLHYFFTNLQKAGFDRVVLVVNYLKEQIEEYVASCGFDFEVTIVDQKNPEGTGHAVLMTKPYVNGNFVVINGDNLFDASELKHINLQDTNTYVYGIEHEQPQHYGVLEIKEGKVLSIMEKPSNPPTNIINAGLYKFTPEVFEKLESIGKSERGEYELTDAIKRLIDEGKVRAGVLHGTYVDLGKLEDIPYVEEYIRGHF